MEKGENIMKKTLLVLGLLLVGGMSACSSMCHDGDRSTASESPTQAYKPSRLDARQ
jgi:hypothetical protein